MAKKKVDNVNHPSHYSDTCSIECIDAMLLIFDKREVMDFCVLNAFKYLWRWEYKGGFEDLKKAEWYLNKANDISKCYYQIYRDSVAYSKITKLLKMLSNAKKKAKDMFDIPESEWLDEREKDECVPERRKVENESTISDNDK